MATVFDVANWFLANTSDVTNKKLQKLTYYAYSWHLTLSNDSPDDLSVRLFPNKFEAWVHGAADPELYAAYKKFGSSCIPHYADAIESFSPDEINILGQVNSTYGRYNGNELESINHQEDPWIKARKNLPWYEPSHELIKDIDIFNYYSRQASE